MGLRSESLIKGMEKIKENKSEADRMFEELGYEKIYEDERVTQYRDEYLNIEITKTEILLNKITLYRTVTINKELYKAINKKCEELGVVIINGRKIYNCNQKTTKLSR